MSDIIQDAPAAFVDLGAAAPRPNARIGRPRVRRGAKIGGALGLLAVAATAILLNDSHVTTDNAVVTAYVVSLRSPIDGQVSGMRQRVGDPVDAGVRIARVVDDRADDRHLVDLEAEATRDRAELSALGAQLRTLLSLRSELADRAERYRAAQSADAAAATHAGAAQLIGSAARLEWSGRTMSRKTALGRTGDTPVASVDAAVFDERAARADLAYQQAHLASLQAREAAAAGGVFLDGGSNDVSYSAQRIDEIDLRVSDVERSIAELAAGLGSAEARLVAERRRFATLSAADLVVAGHGMVWKLGASNNERVGASDAVAEVVDCGASFIVASIPQRDYARIAVGGLARFRLAGETVDREGRVLSVTGDANLAHDRNLAAAPASGTAATGTVRVEVPPSGNSGAACLVGRTARVLLPIAGGGPAARLADAVRGGLWWLGSI